MQLYGSRIEEMRKSFGSFSETDAAAAFGQYLQGVTTDNLLELTYESRKRIHNLKYYTWVEQQGKTYDEIQDQWYEPNYWTDIQGQVGEIDELITEFNDRVGLTK
jgi:cysteine synthase A